MNKHSILFFPISIAAFAFSSTLALAAVPSIDGKGVPAVATCPDQSPVLHFDKIIFSIAASTAIKLTAADPADQATLSAFPRNTELDIKVADDPTTVADLKGKVLTFLGAMDTLKIRSLIKIVSVQYAVVCAQPLETPN